jgi:peptide/nickel transport system substrate-binding protein
MQYWFYYIQLKTQRISWEGNMRVKLAALLMGAAVFASPATADKSDDTLRIAMEFDLENLDAYQNTARVGIILARHVWDGLIYRNPATNEYEGNLATGWQWIDETTLEFSLREGVQFHNGEEFNADDVVHTINYVADPANGVKPARNVVWLAGAEKVDGFTVRVKLNYAFPAAFEFLAGALPMYPNEYHAAVGPDGMAANPVGTGPYKVASHVQGELINLERYDGYHAASPKGVPSIKYIDWRTIPELNTQFAELLSGGLDWAFQIPPDQAENFAAMGKLNVTNEMTMRIGYIGMDASTRHGDTPLDDVRVRRAIAHAVDRQGIVDSLMKGASVVVHSACFPSQFGCEQDVAQYEYSPDKAKALLAEAGYPDGFDLTLSTFYQDAPPEAIQQSLANVGINITLDRSNYAPLRERVHNGEVPFLYMSWGSYSINDVSAITSKFFRGGKDDYAQNPELIEWLTTADTVTDAEVRLLNYSKALKKIASEVYWLPLWTFNSNYVFSKELDFVPTSDEIPRFFTASWK